MVAMLSFAQAMAVLAFTGAATANPLPQSMSTRDCAHQTEQFKEKNIESMADIYLLSQVVLLSRLTQLRNLKLQDLLSRISSMLGADTESLSILGSSSLLTVILSRRGLLWLLARLLDLHMVRPLRAVRKSFMKSLSAAKISAAGLALLLLICKLSSILCV